MTIFWAHRIASICLEDPEARAETLDQSRQYEWQTGYTFDMHLEFIQNRWDEIDGYSKMEKMKRKKMKLKQ